MNNIDNNKIILVLIISFVSFLMFGIVFEKLTNKSNHELRMELIEEKKALLELNEKVDFDKSMFEINKFLDSMDLIVDNELNNTNNK